MATRTTCPRSAQQLLDEAVTRPRGGSGPGWRCQPGERVRVFGLKGRTVLAPHRGGASTV